MARKLVIPDSDASVSLVVVDFLAIFFRSVLALGVVLAFVTLPAPLTAFALGVLLKGGEGGGGVEETNSDEREIRDRRSRFSDKILSEGSEKY